MSRLILVRHAQASFMSANYDQLSALGESQARALGEYWLRLGIEFDEAIAGPRTRHAQTAEIVRDLYLARHCSWPPIETRPELDEHFVDQLLVDRLEELLRQHPSLEPLAREYRAAKSLAEVQRGYHRLFEAICRLWQVRAPGTESIESWEQFQARAVDAVREILYRPGRNRTIAVFTSVGNITAILGSILECAPATALELGWRLKNCSITELIFSGERVTLDQFNSVAHLSDPDTWTYR